MKPWRLRELVQDTGVTAVLLFVGLGGTHPASQDQLEWSRAPDGWAYLLVVLATLPFVLRRRYPIPVAVVSGAAVLTYLTVDYAYGPILFTIPIAAYTLGSMLPRRAAMRWIGGYYLLTLAVTLSRTFRDDGDDLWRQIAVWGVVSLAAFAAPLAIGIASRVRRESEAGVRTALARRAVTEERLRMAAELHDSVGHGLAVIAMQAGVALHVLDREPAKVKEALEAIRDTSRRSLDGLRAQLQQMREPASDEAPRRPSVGLAELDVLVDRIRAGGLDVRTDIDPTVLDGHLPPDLDVAAYRIVQESLTNVLRHAEASRASVTIQRRDGAVVLDVVDNGTAAAGLGADDSGTGIAGMRARAHALGGTLEAGPRPDGGFAVRASLPTDTNMPGSEL
ncbi:MAG TPA: sensor histidine kinase [Jiangellaceae bacterium]|nr:sensor histidine kinase [Jiangellaceae bacterium]